MSRIILILCLLLFAVPGWSATPQLLSEGSDGCSRLPDFYFPVSGPPPAGVTYTDVRDGMAHVRDRYNTGTSCGYLQRDDLKVWFRVAPALKDAEAAPWLIFVVGGPGIPDGFEDPQFLKLRDKYNLVWYEQRGTGRSRLTLAQSSDCRIASLSQNLEDLRALEQLLSPGKPVVLLTHSWGGLLGQLFAARYPSSVSALVMSGTGVGFSFVLHSLLDGNGRYYAYQAFAAKLLEHASPEGLARYNQVAAALLEKLKAGIIVHLRPDFREDRIFLPQFLHVMKDYLFRVKFDLETALEMLEAVAAGTQEPSVLAELAIDSWGQNHILNATVVCADAVPGILPQLSPQVAELVTVGCEEVAPSCRNAPVDFEAAIRNIVAPTLILAGTADEILPFEEQRQLAKMIPGSTFVELAGERHGAIMDHNYRAFPAVMKFLGVPANWTPTTWQSELQ